MLLPVAADLFTLSHSSGCASFACTHCSWRGKQRLFNIKHQRVRVHLTISFSCLGFACFSLLVYFCECVCTVCAFPPDTSTGGWETVCEHRLPLSLTHPPSSSFNTHLLFSSLLWSKQNVQNLLISWPSCCSSLSFALKQRRLSLSCSYGFWNVLKHRSSLFLFACFLSSLLCWVDLIASCSPEVSTFNPRCFRPENAYIRFKFAMRV